ncbi:hypothetical protein U1Q18_029268 [Sarracenia purpurea var. burkii]
MLHQLYLIFFKVVAVCDIPSVLKPFRLMTLLLFVLMNEVLFFFSMASYFALFLHNVENRFFTALSVLYKQSSKEIKPIFTENFSTAKEKHNIRTVNTCLKPPLLFRSIYYQRSFEPAVDLKAVVVHNTLFNRKGRFDDDEGSSEDDDDTNLSSLKSLSSDSSDSFRRNKGDRRPRQRTSQRRRREDGRKESETSPKLPLQDKVKGNTETPNPELPPAATDGRKCSPSTDCHRLLIVCK